MNRLSLFLFSSVLTNGILLLGLGEGISGAGILGRGCLILLAAIGSFYTGDFNALVRGSLFLKGMGGILRSWPR
ncbi:MAG: hypothetical protein HYZ90_00860 [Candidatus Omnitrophica bacterium]|nr:hypothetical protein [Candidatus Omnitrophota bacterium]